MARGWWLGAFALVVAIALAWLIWQGPLGHEPCNCPEQPPPAAEPRIAGKARFDALDIEVQVEEAVAQWQLTYIVTATGSGDISLRVRLPSGASLQGLELDNGRQQFVGDVIMRGTNTNAANAANTDSHVRALELSHNMVHIEVPAEKGDTWIATIAYAAEVPLFNGSRQLVLNLEDLGDKPPGRTTFNATMHSKHGLYNVTTLTQGYDVIAFDRNNSQVTGAWVGRPPSPAVIWDEGPGEFLAAIVCGAPPGGDFAEGLVFMRARSTQSPDLDVVYLMDKSGSMTGQGRIGAARSALANNLDYLGPDDQYGVILFDSGTHPMHEALQLVGPQISADQAEILTTKASGGTAILDSLLQGLDLLGNMDESRTPLLVIITDGMVGESADQLISAYDRRDLRDTDVHFITIGNDLRNTPVAELVEHAGGSFQHVEAGDPFINTTINDMLLSLRRPAWGAVEIQLGGLARARDLEGLIPTMFEDTTVALAFGDEWPANKPLRLRVEGNAGGNAKTFQTTWNHGDCAILDAARILAGQTQMQRLQTQFEEARFDGADSKAMDAIMANMTKTGMRTDQEGWTTQWAIIHEGASQVVARSTPYTPPAQEAIKMPGEEPHKDTPGIPLLMVLLALGLTARQTGRTTRTKSPRP